MRRLDPVQLFAFFMCTLMGGAFVFGFARPAAAQNAAATVDLVEVSGIIDPTVADYLTGRLSAAQEAGVQAVVIQLDTPGGLDTSMRSIIRQMLASRVPIVVWVAPRGARAASAGTFISYAANLTYMAEATEIGPRRRST